jgi:hypothetical protein
MSVRSDCTIGHTYTCTETREVIADRSPGARGAVSNLFYVDRFTQVWCQK